MHLNQKALLALTALSLWLTISDHARSGSQNRLVLFTSEEAGQLRLTEKEWDGQSIIKQESYKKPGINIRQDFDGTIKKELKEGIIQPELYIGPDIVIQKPEVVQTGKGPTIYTVSPTDLSVSFQENQAPVDMSTLKIWAKKGLFKKSLTELLKPYMKGTVLRAESVNIPEGRFQIGFEIADERGRKTIGEYRLEVR